MLNLIIYHAKTFLNIPHLKEEVQFVQPALMHVLVCVQAIEICLQTRIKIS